MFEKILTELKTKYKNLGLSETILKAKAKQIEKAVKTEEEIAEAVAGVEDDLAIFQSFADQNRTLATKIAELEKGKGSGKTDDEPDDKADKDKDKPAGEVPAWAQAIIDSNKTLSESLIAIKAKETAETNAQKLQAKLTELKVPQSFLKLIPQDKVFATDEEINAYATEIKTNADAIFQEASNGVLGATPKPLFGEAVKETGVSSDVQNYIKTKFNNETDNKS